jgi:hypothetical protein
LRRKSVPLEDLFSPKELIEKRLSNKNLFSYAGTDNTIERRT